MLHEECYNKSMKKFIRKLKQLYYLITACIIKDKSAFLHVIKFEAENYLEDCCNSGTKQIEEMQDLLFHINSYLDVPSAVMVTMYPDLIGTSFKDEPIKFADYLQEVEKQRSVERLFIMESLKHFPFEPCF